MPARVLAVLMLGAMAFPAAAIACAACNSGDETISAVGEELLDGRGGRLAVQFRSWGESEHVHSTASASGTGLHELRADLSASMRPMPGLAVALAVPLQLRDIATYTANERVLGLGDVDLSARYVAWSCPCEDGAHVLSLLGGLELPTAPAQRLEQGEPLDLDLQLGTGSFDPRVAIAYALTYGKWTFLSQAGVRAPTEGWDRYRVGPSVRAELGAQLQPLRQLGLRLGIEGRVQGTDFHRGYTVHGSDGAIASAQAGVLFRPWAKATIQLQASIPFAATGSRTAELPVFGAGFAHDL